VIIYLRNTSRPARPVLASKMRARPGIRLSIQRSRPWVIRRSRAAEHRGSDG